MGVQLNIKNPDTVHLAHKVAKAGKTSVTGAIHSALEKVDAEHTATRTAQIAEVMALIKEFNEKIPDEWRNKTSKELMDAIYDDDQPDGFAR